MSGGAAGDDLYLSAGGEVDAGRAGADRLEQRRMGLLDGLGQNPDIVDVGEIAVVGKCLLGPCLDDDVDGLLEAVAAGVDIDANAFKLLALVAGADTKIEPTATDDVQHRDFFCHQNRIVQGQDNYGGADAYVGGSPGYGAQEGPDSREQAMTREAVLAQPGFVDAGLIRECDLLQSVVQCLFLGKVLVVRDDGKDSELHVASLFRRRWAPIGTTRRRSTGGWGGVRPVFVAQLYYSDGVNEKDAKWESRLGLDGAGRKVGRDCRDGMIAGNDGEAG